MIINHILLSWISCGTLTDITASWRRTLTSVLTRTWIAYISSLTVFSSVALKTLTHKRAAWTRRAAAISIRDSTVVVNKLSTRSTIVSIGARTTVISIRTRAAIIISIWTRTVRRASTTNIAHRVASVRWANHWTSTVHCKCSGVRRRHVRTVCAHSRSSVGVRATWSTRTAVIGIWGRWRSSG